MMILMLAAGLVAGCIPSTTPSADAGAESPLIGQPVDIAPSAYRYRADRKPEANPPESWLALMHFANLPLNQPVNLNTPAIGRSLCALLWEEIRPVQTLQLTWPSNSKHRPGPEALVISVLMNQGASSSWWNNLASVDLDAKPIVSDGGRTYSYSLAQNTCGLIVSVAGNRKASQYDVPQVRVLVPDTWKKMDLEIEWGFEPATSNRDYSGHVEAYDGRVSNLKALSEGSVTGRDSWNSARSSGSRRGVKMSLLYMGTSKWRRQQPYTTQPEDVARTIVTVWTKAGNFSFLAADLENGPIYAPEYGFFVRRTSALALSTKSSRSSLRLNATILSTKMNSIAGESQLKGWGSDETPWVGSNPTGVPLSPLGVALPSRCVAMHPGQFADVVAEWHSPISGKFDVSANLSHAQVGSNGIEWSIIRVTQDREVSLAHGSTTGTGSVEIPGDGGQRAMLTSVSVVSGDSLKLVIGSKGDNRCDTTIVDLTITEAERTRKVVQGVAAVRILKIWNLAKDVGPTLHDGNPHADSFGNPGVWRFGSQMPTSQVAEMPSDPPIATASQARSARAYVRELKARGLKTIRERTREHEEQTWEAAVAAARGPNLPAHPKPPAGSEPAMQVDVPSDRLNAQWKLAAWHLTRHCEKNPNTGRLWFNDFPYGILGAETYMVLAVLDLMGSHEAAADGFDQWVSLPMDPNSKGHHEWALPDRPNGLFSEGHGALTHAVGPPGYGGQMDGVHAFGPGSIGWALTEHYWMTGDKAWLRDSATRIKANADWMLRQRQVVTKMVPGGGRLWCKGLQPALQVTPDSGGLWMQFYECEAYYWASVSRFSVTLAEVDPAAGAQLKAEAESYRKDLKAAVERSIALSPVVQVRDGTFHSVIPFACYVRGLGTGSWGWQRDGSGSHVGPLYWETVQSAAALISPAGLLSVDDVRVQGYLDVLEDRLLLENANVGNRDWFEAGWQYQGGLERTANMHLAADDIPVFLRSFFNCYAVDILPNDGYVFNEHAVHGPPDKIFEEAAFLERFRNLLVMEDGDRLWLARGTPRSWLEQGKRISVKHAPTQFGTIDYQIASEASSGKILATVSMPSRNPPAIVLLRLRHPLSRPISGVTVNGKEWKDFDANREVVNLHGLKGEVKVEVRY